MLLQITQVPRGSIADKVRICTFERDSAVRCP